MKRIKKTLAAVMLLTMMFTVGCAPENNDADVRVTTYTPQDITATTAVCGGDVIVTQGLTLNELGVCWSESRNPTVEDSHLSTNIWSEPYVCTITELEPRTKYHVRAYALRGLEYYYGEDKSFTTEENGGGFAEEYIIGVSANPSDGGIVNGGGSYFQGDSCTVAATANTGYTFVNWTEEGEVVSSEESYTFTVTGDRSLCANFDHAYVDLGLPSGTLWATRNVGADTPEDYGEYFAWGETTPKATYSWSTYKYCMGSEKTLTKYCNNPYYGYNGFTDNLDILQPSDDAATANWGNGWCMPTYDQWEELKQHTTSQWTTQNGVSGRLFTATNGNSLFLPAAGYRWDNELYYAGNDGYSWSCSLKSIDQHDAMGFHIDSGGCGLHPYYRNYGQPVRPVRSSLQN